MGSCFSKGATNGDDPVHLTDGNNGNVQFISTKESWDEKIAVASETGKLVVVNFSAAWCGPCRMIAPLYSELSEKYPSIIFLTVDVDEVSELGSSWEIRATPTFFFLEDGKQVDKLVGANRPELQKKIVTFAESHQCPQ